MAKKKAKRYTDAQKKEVLDFIEAEGRGGMTKAVKKFKVTAASIANWKRQAGGDVASTRAGKVSGKASKELQNIQALASILTEIEATETHLATLQKQYKKARAKI